MTPYSPVGANYLSPHKSQTWNSVKFIQFVIQCCQWLICLVLMCVVNCKVNLKGDKQMNFLICNTLYQRLQCQQTQIRKEVFRILKGTPKSWLETFLVGTVSTHERRNISLNCITSISFIFFFEFVIYEEHLESKERFAIKKYLLIIGKKKNMQVLSHTFTYFFT